MSAAIHNTETLFLKPNGRVPNSRFPVLIHRQVWGSSDAANLADILEKTFVDNNWLNNWREVVYGYYHYHSTTHEVLGIAHGEVTLRLGGDGGQDVNFSAGDVLILPAGVSHNQIKQSSDLQIVGGYPQGRSRDLIRDEEVSESVAKAAVLRIATLPMPQQDPVTGTVIEAWRMAPRSYGIE